ISSEEAFFLALLPQLQAPDDHGHSLEALAQSLIEGGINGVEPPLCIINVNVHAMPEQLAAFASNVSAIYDKASAAGKKIRVFEE
ncbi:MAG: hypothetical protein AAGI11_14115, partial [Pseudomonadota bacterium]